MSDTLQNLGDFQPRVVQTQAEGVARQLTDSELASVLDGPYLAHRQGSDLELTVRGATGSLVRLGLGSDNSFFTLAFSHDGSTTWTLCLSDYLNSRTAELTPEQQAVLKEPKAQYSMAYVTVLPKQSAAIVNEVKITSSNYPDDQSGKGSYSYDTAIGWGEG